MSDVRWVRVTTTGNIPVREGRAVLVGDRELALFNLGDRFLATDNRCPHEGGPLCDGIVTGSSVVCPLHAWKVNLASGNVERPAHGKDHCVTTYPTRVEDGVVIVGISAASAAGRAPSPSVSCGTGRAPSPSVSCGTGPAPSPSVPCGADPAPSPSVSCGAGPAPATERADPPRNTEAA